MPRSKTRQMCSVPDCTRNADYNVFLEDYKRSYGGDGHFCEPDESCPFLCEEHKAENEAEKVMHDNTGEYPYSKWGRKWFWVSGWTTYEPLARADADSPD